VGVYLHGSLAMGSYFPPKSDMDFIIVTSDRLEADLAQSLNLSIAQYAENRPTAGGIECSVITLQTARDVPEQTPYELHYSESCLDDAATYGAEKFDPDLPAHLMCVKKSGVCLYGMTIDDVFGEVSRHNFLLSVMYDFSWIVEDENICESPYYGVLNLCRVLQIVSEQNASEKNTSEGVAGKKIADEKIADEKFAGEKTEETEKYLSKYEAALWGIENLPSEHIPLIQKALEVYASDKPINKREQKTGGVTWDHPALLAFRDYARDYVRENISRELVPISFFEAKLQKSSFFVEIYFL
jgi:streptomycin 3"-adenylyltransferase